MAKAYSDGGEVTWTWGNGTGTYTDRITRNASEDDPAHLVEQEGGDEVLKSGREIARA